MDISELNAYRKVEMIRKEHPSNAKDKIDFYAQNRRIEDSSLKSRNLKRLGDKFTLELVFEDISKNEIWEIISDKPQKIILSMKRIS